MSKCTPVSVVDKYKDQIKAGKGDVAIDDLQTGNIRSIQARAGISQDTVDDYAALMAGSRGRGNAAAEFPPVRIWQVMRALYLTAGAHRWRAAKLAHRDTVEAEFFTGEYLDALKDAIASNAKHGLRPSRADIRHSLKLLFEHAQYRKASDNSLARLVGCSATTVGKVRADLDAEGDGKRTDAKGRQIDTTKIGKAKKKPKEKPAPLSKMESGDDRCHACWARVKVDATRCQRCIDEDRPLVPEDEDDARPDDEPEVIDDAEEDDSEVVGLMRAWNKAIESIARHLGKLDEGLTVLGRSPWFDADRLGRIETHITAAVDELRAIKGYKTCPKCCGAEDGCTYCLKTGFVTRAVFDSLETDE